MSRSEYDVIVIGAGIGGLVCGCYLAKAGVKALIVEQQANVGGYCVSFRRKGFTFDACVHSIGSLRQGGMFRKILEGLDIDPDMLFLSCDPSDLVINSDGEFFITSDKYRNISNFQKRFPGEKRSIEKFFSIVKEESNLTICSELKKDLSYADFLESLFKDNGLKDILKVFLGNIGLSAERISALTATILLREHVFDGGYYPRGGTQAMALELAKVFLKNGGRILLKSKVEKILVKDGATKGVCLKDECINSRYIVCACDMKQVLLKLIDDYTVKEKASKLLMKNKSSISSFMIYAGLNSSVDELFKGTRANIWFSDNRGNELDFVFCSSPSIKEASLAPQNKDCLEIMILADYNTKKYWLNNKDTVKESVLSRVSGLFPDITSKSEVMETATPFTLERYTSNDRGALYGWESTPDQLQIGRSVSREIKIGNMFFSGHWAGSGFGYGGVPSVAYSGRNVANILLEKVRGS